MSRWEFNDGFPLLERSIEPRSGESSAELSTLTSPVFLDNPPCSTNRTIHVCWLRTGANYQLIFRAHPKPMGLTRATTQGCSVVHADGYDVTCAIYIPYSLFEPPRMRLAFSFDSMFIAKVFLSSISLASWTRSIINSQHVKPNWF